MEDSQINILLVEDNPQDARLIKEEISGVMDIVFDFKTTESLQDTFLFIDKNIVDVILLDLSLPDSNGIETFHKMKEKTDKIPVVILSGLKDEELALHAVQEGAQDYLVKGEIDAKLLVKAIRYAIERHKIYRELESCKAELERLKKQASQMAS